MPVATTSSRKARLRRKNSSDIEEDEHTQAIQDDVDNSDGERPRRALKVEKKQNKANGKKRAVAESFELEQDDEASDDERIDVENLTNQPLRKADERWLHGLSSDWLAMEGMIRTNWSGIGDVATAMADAVEGGQGEEVSAVGFSDVSLVFYYRQGLEELDGIMKDLIDSGAEMKVHAVALTEIHQLLIRGEEIVSNPLAVKTTVIYWFVRLMSARDIFLELLRKSVIMLQRRRVKNTRRTRNISNSKPIYMLDLCYLQVDLGLTVTRKCYIRIPPCLPSLILSPEVPHYANFSSYSHFTIF